MVQCSGSCDDDKDYDKDDGTKDLQTREAQGFGFRAYDSYPFRVRCCVFKGVSRFQRFCPCARERLADRRRTTHVLNDRAWAKAQAQRSQYPLIKEYTLNHNIRASIN